MLNFQKKPSTFKKNYTERMRFFRKEKKCLPRIKKEFSRPEAVCSRNRTYMTVQTVVCIYHATLPHSTQSTSAFARYTAV